MNTATPFTKYQNLGSKSSAVFPPSEGPISQVFTPAIKEDHKDKQINLLEEMKQSKSVRCNQFSRNVSF